MKKEEKILKEEFKNTEIGKNMYKKSNKKGIKFIVILVLCSILLIVSLYVEELSEAIPIFSKIVLPVFELSLFLVGVEWAEAIGDFNGAFKYFKWEKENKKIKD